MSLLAYGSESVGSNDVEPDELVNFNTMLMERQGYYLEQYVSGVVDFSSQYGIDYSISYTAANVIGRPTQFPAYGDYPETFTMRTYGDWWLRSPSSTNEIQPQNLPSVVPHDFIVVCFEEFVVPSEVAIFETFNPGAVVRIWAHNNHPTKRWVCLWEVSSSEQHQLNSQQIRQTRVARRFAPTLKNKSIITKTLRIEFNHSHLHYYTQIDAIMLCGRSVSRRNMQNLMKQTHSQAGSITRKLRNLKFQASCDESCKLKLHEFINKDLNKFLLENGIERTLVPQTSQSALREEQSQATEVSISLTELPFEILFKILSFLDLKSLFRVGQVSRTFYDISTHPLLYGELSLKAYWRHASSELLCTLAHRATMLRKLDLSWCGAFGDISPTEFKKFLTQRGDNLTHLRLNSCKFLNASCIETVGIVCDNLTELSLRNCAIDTPLLNFSCLVNLKNLERLDLFQTSFESELLLSMLEGNRKLKYLNLAFCGVTVNMDNVAAHLSTYNTQLVALDMWKAHFLTARGLISLSKCHQLEELDLGWCLRDASLGDALFQLLSNCPKFKKLFLSAVRGITDRDLMHVAKLGKNLEQLDLMGILSITHERVYDILLHCNKLKLLDLSFCDNILDRDYDVLMDWSRMFDVDIKSSHVRHDAR